jgi:hypothetical protein
MNSSLEDPRGRRSEALVFDGQRARKAGDEGRARALFAEAAELEAQVARDIPADSPSVRSVLAISAVTLCLDACEYEEAARTACEFLARPELLSEQGKADLEVLLERAFHERHEQRGSAKVGGERVQIEGVLKVVNLRARRPYIGVETAEGDLSRFFIERALLEDTLGSKLNRRVRMSGVRRQRRDGRVVKDALEVVLVEGKAAQRTTRRAAHRSRQLAAVWHAPACRT